MTSVAAMQPFQTFLDEHRAGVLAFLRAMVGPDAAEDCFQETFIAALRHYDELDADNPRAWLLRVARNKAIDHFRLRARSPVPTEKLDEIPAPSEPDDDPELWRRVAALPEKQRAAVALRFVSDLRFKDVGAAMETSEEAARRNVHEGLKRLLAEIESEERG
ncbi:RNA polymerase sigma factor [soil metagenome]